MKIQKGQIVMVSKNEEVCGSFAVLTEQREIKKIVVIQDALSYYTKEKSDSKKFRLESLDGVSVYQTEDPYIFRQDNGSLLKKINR